MLANIFLVGTLFLSLQGIFLAEARKTRKNHFQEVSTNSLRKESIELEQIVREKGYMLNYYYDKTYCKQPNQKWGYQLNYCGPDMYEPGNYVMITAQADPQKNVYTEYETVYSDSACTVPVANGQTVSSEGILICFAASWWTTQSQLNHVRNDPLVQTKDNLDYTLSIYSSQSACQTNGWSGLVDIEYVKFGSCTGYNGYDIIINSCTSDSLTGYTYTSSDFSCSGTPSPITISKTSTCSSGNSNIVGYFSGYSNFVCAPGV